MKNCPPKRLPFFSKKFLCLSIGLVLSQNAFSSYLTPNERLYVFNQYYKTGISTLRTVIESNLEEISQTEKSLLSNISTLENWGFGYYDFDKTDPNSIKKLTEKFLSYKIDKVGRLLVLSRDFINEVEGIKRISSVVDGYKDIIQDAKKAAEHEITKYLSEGKYKKAVDSMANLIISGDGTLLENIQDAMEKGKKIFYKNPKKAIYDLPKEIFEVINLFNSVAEDKISEEYKQQFLANSLFIASKEFSSLFNAPGNKGRDFYAQELIIKKLKYAGFTDEELKNQIIMKPEFHDGFWSKSWSFSTDTYGNVVRRKQAIQNDISFGKSKSEIEAQKKAEYEAEKEKRMQDLEKIWKEKEKRKERWEARKKAISDYALNKINNTVDELRNTFDYLSNDLKKKIEEHDKRNAKSRNPTSSEKLAPVIPPPVREVPKQDTATNQKRPVQEKPTQNNRGQDLTPDKGVATVQPPQRPTQEYPVYQPSRPIGSNNDETRPPVNKAPGPNEHGVVSTGEGSNGLVPAPSPSGSNIEPPHKAPDPDKTKELQAKIKNLKELRDSFIYKFKYSTDQINAAIKEKRVNNETINIANNANIDRKTALEFDKKVSELENEYARLVGDYQYFYRSIEIGDPININSLNNLISNQDKNRQTYKDLAEWGGIELDPEIASKLYSNDYLEKKYINGTPIKDLPTKGNAKYNGISDGKTVVKFQDTGETYDSYQFHSNFDLDVNFERQTVTPSFSNIETYNHKSPGANTGWGTTHRIFNKDETYSDIGISSFNGTAGFKGKAIPQNCKLYCQDEEYQFVGAFSGPDAQQVSGLYQGKGNFKDGVNNSRDIISETTGVFGARRDNFHVPHVGVKESSGIITSYDSLSGWGGITLDDKFKNTLPTDYYAGQNNFHATVASEIPKTGTANYYGSAQMQRINSQNKNVMSNHTSDFEMSVDFQKQTVDSYFKNISSGAGLDHIYFEGVPIETYQHEILSEQQITGFRRENKSSKIVGAFVGPKAEKTVGMFEVEVNKDSQLQGTFHGDKQ